MSTEDFKRKLTAILSADVAGYSKLMGDDEAATVKTLEAYKGVMFSLIRQHRGRVVDSPGDNLLADFGSVVDAVQCAVSIQKELQTRNAGLPEDRRMAFRIGINLGDVIEEEDRIYGDGVNIAARLEALADPGGICVSKTAFDHIESKLPLGYEFLGDQTVKNIAKPVGAYKVLMETRVVNAKTEREAKIASFWRKKLVLFLGIIVILAIAVVLYWNFILREPSIEPASIEPEQAPVVSDVEEALKTIAVLPFEDISPEKDQEYFVDGLSEEILNSLTKIQDLRVIARTSSFSFKGTDKKVQEIADELGASHILEGSVRKAGDKLRITAQLIRAVDGIHLWSEIYDRKLEDIFVVQEDIAATVGEELKATLGIEKSYRQLGGTENEKAYELYLIAQGQKYEATYAAYTAALKSIEAAIELDPQFALAWTFKATIHWERTIFGPPSLADSEKDAGKSAAQRAIELKPDLGQAHLSLGVIDMARGEFVKAERAYQKGVELQPEIINYFDYGVDRFYSAVGYLKKYNETISQFRKIDPLNQILRMWYIFSFGLLGDMSSVEKELKSADALFGDDWGIGDSPLDLINVCFNDVIRPDEIKFPNRIFQLAKEHLSSPEEGIKALHQIYNENPSSAEFIYISFWAAYFTDPEFAMDSLEKGIEIDASGLFFAWLPAMHEVRQLPRFKKFVRKIGLVDYWELFGWPDLCYPTDAGDFVCD